MIKYLGTWAKTNKRTATNDVTPAVVLVLLAAAVVFVFSLAYRNVNQTQLEFERGGFRPGPYWQEVVR